MSGPGWERYLIDLILRRPGFHRAVTKVHTQIHRLQNKGEAPNYAPRGGTHLEESSEGSSRKLGDLIKLFWEEIRTGHNKTGGNGKGGAKP